MGNMRDPRIVNGDGRDYGASPGRHPALEGRARDGPHMGRVSPDEVRSPQGSSGDQPRAAGRRLRPRRPDDLFHRQNHKSHRLVPFPPSHHRSPLPRRCPHPGHVSAPRFRLHWLNFLLLQSRPQQGTISSLLFSSLQCNSSNIFYAI